MQPGEFSSVLVPVEFESKARGKATATDAASPDETDPIAIGPYTAQALELAARLARGGQILLVHARHDGSEHATWMSARKMIEFSVSAREQATALLKAAAQRYCPDLEPVYIIEPGDALEVILEAAKAHAPDAIVLAASSRGRLNRAFHGSTADKLIRRAPCPVMVLPSTKG